MDQNGAKGISIVILLVVALAAGWVPVWLHKRAILTATGSRRRKLVLDFISCFAGGVFLSTCLLHILAEGREEFEEYKQKVHFDNDFPFFEAVAGVGLFLVAVVEKMGFAIMSGSGQHQHEDEENPSSANGSKSPHSALSSAHYRGYGSTEDVEVGRPSSAEDRAAVGGHSNLTYSSSGQPNGTDWGPHKTASPDTVLHLPPHTEVVSGGKREGGVDSTASGEHHHHHHSLMTSTSCQSSRKLSMMRSVLLLLALSFHSVFDGLAVGLQTSATGVWEVLTAIAIHKTLVAFCLGLELAAASTGQRTRPLALIVLFAIISPIGIGIGMGVTSAAVNELAQLLASSILQAIATGTFLYVTFFEILGQQFSHSHSGHVSLCLELGKVAAAVLGFACMASVKLLEKD